MMSFTKHLFLCLSAMLCTSVSAQISFEDYFLEKTMRLDYYHAGNAQEEYFFFDEVIEEPYWAGNKHYLIEHRNVGNLMFFVKDKTSGTLL
jgi:hypothetical protein